MSIPIDIGTQAMVDRVCEHDLKESVAMAAQFARMRREGTIRNEVSFADFIAIAKVARNWLPPSMLREAESKVMQEMVRERE